MLSRRCSFPVYWCVLAAFSFAVLSCLICIYRLNDFHSEGQAIHELMRKCRRAPTPIGCNQIYWEELWTINVSCASNIAMSQSHMSTPEVLSLRKRLESECQSPLTLESARKVFEVFARSCHYGQLYTSQFRGEFDRCFKAASDSSTNSTGHPK